MKITATKIYELEESIIASGLPMDPFYEEGEFISKVQIEKIPNHSSNHLKRAIKLCQAKDGSGHKTFLAGILVSLNITATNAWWLQFGRYHHQQIVSSQSKMHRLKPMLDGFSNGASIFHESVSQKSIDALLSTPKDQPEETLIYNCPIGLEQTARVTTNYLQLRSIYVQRRNHKLKEWHIFCDWVESLPYAKEFLTSGVFSVPVFIQNLKEAFSRLEQRGPVETVFYNPGIKKSFINHGVCPEEDFEGLFWGAKAVPNNCIKENAALLLGANGEFENVEC